MTTSNRVEFTTEMKTRLHHPRAEHGADPLRHCCGTCCVNYGYKVELLQNDGRAVVDAGLKYVHNDTCYPALLVIGQFIDALKSGKYDLDTTSR